MVKNLLSVILLCTFVAGCGGCNINKEAFDKIAGSLEDVSNSATSLMDQINELTRLIDSKVESRELDEQVGALLDQRLANLMALLDNSMQNSGGYLFDQANGTINNTFANIRMILDQINKGILQGSLPSLMEQLAGQLQLQINTISMSLEDLVVITTEGAVLVVDKTINGIVLAISVIALCVGLLIFIIILIRMRNSLNTANVIGICFMGIFTAFFLVLTISSSVRGNIIAGFNFAEKRTVKPLTPVVTGIIPEKLTLGTTKNVYIYGKHLNKLKKLSVALYQGQQKSFTFPDKSVVVATSNRIVLGNFGELLNWRPIAFPTYKIAVINNSENFSITDDDLNSFSRAFRNARLLTLPARNDIRIAPRINIITVPGMDANKIEKLRLINSKFFNNTYKIAEGEYALNVIADTVRVESPQYLAVSYPPPPAKLPDISCTDIRWTGGLPAVKGQSISLDVDFYIQDAQELTVPFQAKITSSPPTTVLLVDVPMGKVAAAQQNGGKVTVTTRTFSVANKGDYAFTISIDDLNAAAESNETNNTFSRILSAREFVYNASFDNFKVQSGFAGGTLTFTIVCAAGSKSSVQKTQTSVSSKGEIAVSNTGSLSGIHSGEIISVSMSATFSIYMPFIGTITFPVGDDIYNLPVTDFITDNHESKEYIIERKPTTNATFYGRCRITRVRG